MARVSVAPRGERLSFEQATCGRAVAPGETAEAREGEEAQVAKYQAIDLATLRGSLHEHSACTFHESDIPLGCIAEHGKCCLIGWAVIGCFRLLQAIEFYQHSTLQ